MFRSNLNGDLGVRCNVDGRFRSWASSPRYAHNNVSVGDADGDHRVRTDDNVVANLHAPEDLGSGPDDNSVPDRRLPLFASSMAKSHLLVQTQTSSGYDVMTDYYPYGMNKRETRPNLCRRVEFGACSSYCVRLNEKRNRAEFPTPQLVRNSEPKHCSDSRITNNPNSHSDPSAQTVNLPQCSHVPKIFAGRFQHYHSLCVEFKPFSPVERKPVSIQIRWDLGASSLSRPIVGLFGPGRVASGASVAV